jgi:hypothetical protein
MQVLILKSFPCARDPHGITTAVLKAGEIHDVRDDLVAGLRKAGFVGDVPKARSEELPAPPAEERGESAGQETTEDAPSNGELALRHIGRGKFAVYRGDERLTTDPLTKDEAGAALAAMSP